MALRRRTIAITALAIVFAPCAVFAQRSGDGFLFGEPRATLTIRTGWAHASSRSDLFSYTTELLTLNRGDFSAPTIAFDVAWPLDSRTLVVASLGFAETSHRSEFRDYVDNNNLPIEQTTEFARRPLTIGLKYYLVSPGRLIGRYAWIPARVAPYLGAGLGTMYYSFHQTGDFIDFSDMSVFSSQYHSDGWAPTMHAGAGVDYSLSSRVALTGDARYTHARATLSQDFSGFERLDLSGLGFTLGVTLRF